jgi:hypothetical protein
MIIDIALVRHVRQTIHSDIESTLPIIRSNLRPRSVAQCVAGLDFGDYIRTLFGFFHLKQLIPAQASCFSNKHAGGGAKNLASVYHCRPKLRFKNHA